MAEKKTRTRRSRRSTRTKVCGNSLRFASGRAYVCNLPAGHEGTCKSGTFEWDHGIWSLGSGNSSEVDDQIDWDLVEDVADTFLLQNPHLLTKDGASLQCVSASERFVQSLIAAGVVKSEDRHKLWTIPCHSMKKGLTLGDHVYPVTAEDHCVVRLGSRVYDWSVRQYLPEADVPLVAVLDS